MRFPLRLCKKIHQHGGHKAMQRRILFLYKQLKKENGEQVDSSTQPTIFILKG